MQSDSIVRSHWAICRQRPLWELAWCIHKFKSDSMLESTGILEPCGRPFLRAVDLVVSSCSWCRENCRMIFPRICAIFWMVVSSWSLIFLGNLFKVYSLWDDSEMVILLEFRMNPWYSSSCIGVKMIFIGWLWIPGILEAAWLWLNVSWLPLWILPLSACCPDLGFQASLVWTLQVSSALWTWMVHCLALTGV